MLDAIDFRWIPKGLEHGQYKADLAESLAFHLNGTLSKRNCYATAEFFRNKMFYMLYDQFSSQIAAITYDQDEKEWVTYFSKGSAVSYNDIWAVNRLIEAITAMGGTDKGWTYPVSALESLNF